MDLHVVHSYVFRIERFPYMSVMNKIRCKAGKDLKLFMDY